MGVRIVNPQKKGPALVLFQPGKDSFVDLAGCTVPAVVRKAVLIEVKALVQVELRFNDAQGDEGCSGEALLAPTLWPLL
jgi:hypothetical protein